MIYNTISRNISVYKFVMKSMSYPFNKILKHYISITDISITLKLEKQFLPLA